MKKENRALEEKRIAAEDAMDKELAGLTGGQPVDSDPVDGEYWFRSPGATMTPPGEK